MQCHFGSEIFKKTDSHISSQIPIEKYTVSLLLKFRSENQGESTRKMRKSLFQSFSVKIQWENICKTHKGQRDKTCILNCCIPTLVCFTLALSAN